MLCLRTPTHIQRGPTGVTVWTWVQPHMSIAQHRFLFAHFAFSSDRFSSGVWVLACFWAQVFIVGNRHPGRILSYLERHRPNSG